MGFAVYCTGSPLFICCRLPRCTHNASLLTETARHTQRPLADCVCSLSFAFQDLLTLMCVRKWMPAISRVWVSVGLRLVAFTYIRLYTLCFFLFFRKLVAFCSNCFQIS